MAMKLGGGKGACVMVKASLASQAIDGRAALR
jgi:hypothetical protein